MAESFSVSPVQQESCIERIILAIRNISCETSGKTHKKHKKQKNLKPSSAPGEETVVFRLYFASVALGSARRFRAHVQRIIKSEKWNF